MSSDEIGTEPESAREAHAVPVARQRRTGWHPVNTGHLVMGVAFLGLVVVWALVASDTVDLADRGWVMGLPWLAAGAVGLVVTVLRGPREAHHDGYGDDRASGTMHGWQ